MLAGNLSGLDPPTLLLSDCVGAGSNHFSYGMIHAMINENSLGAMHKCLMSQDKKMMLS